MLKTIQKSADPKRSFRKRWEALKSLPTGLPRAENGDWVVMSAEIDPEDEASGDVIRVAGMKVAKDLPLLAQHRHSTMDGAPTVIGKVAETRDSEIVWKNKSVPAKLGRFVWADTDLAKSYKQLWPEFLNKVSVGCRVMKSRALNAEKPWDGYEYLETELYELSIVTVPANPAASVVRQIQRVLGDDAIIEDTQELIGRITYHLDVKFDESTNGLLAVLRDIKAAQDQINKRLDKAMDDYECILASKPDDTEQAAGSQAPQAPTVDLSAILAQLSKMTAK